MVGLHQQVLRQGRVVLQTLASGMRFARPLKTLLLAALAAIMIIALVGSWLALWPGGSGRFARYDTTISVPAPWKLTRNFVDYMTVGGTTLYAAYMSHGLVALVDLPSAHVISTISGVSHVHGVAVDRDDGLGFASSGSDKSVAVFDLQTYKVLKSITLAAGEPDAILYDRKAALVYVANQETASGTLIDPATQAVVASIPLGGGGPEFCQADPNTGYIYQNLEETNEVVVIDPFKRAVVSRFRLPAGQSPTGLALDAANHRLFVTGMQRKLVILDSRDGALVATLPIGSLSDGVDYDPGLHRAYTANGIGSMTVIQEYSPDRYAVVETVSTRFGSHALAVDPVTHRIYLASFGSILVYDAPTDVLL